MPVTQAQIKALFTSYGVPVATATETEAQRLARITNEVNSGQRTLSQVATSVQYIVTTQTSNRQWLIEQWQYLYDRPPTEADIQTHLGYLSSGQSRATWLANAEKKDAVLSTQRIYQQVLGRAPTEAELNSWVTNFRQGTATRASLTSYLGGTTEALTRPKPSAEQEGAVDAQARLNQILAEFGLESLSGWAWEQVKLGYSETFILQELRKQPAYLERFSGMEARRQAGLAPLSEAEYIEYEQNARYIMRQNGMPPSFYDNPQDFAQLIAADLSLDELNMRVTEGYSRVTQAPVEIRQAFAELYGVDGDAALAALFIDPDKGEQALLKQARTAETKGWGGLFGFEFDLTEAERVAEIDITSEQLRSGLGRIQEVGAVFDESVSETQDLRAEDEGAEAVFGLGGTGAIDIEKRRRTRVAATSGGGGANVDRTGVNLGAAD